jgi:hypothetical protein
MKKSQNCKNHQGFTKFLYLLVDGRILSRNKIRIRGPKNLRIRTLVGPVKNSLGAPGYLRGYKGDTWRVIREIPKG